MQLNNYNVPGGDMRVSVLAQFESEDLSGETSSTSSAHKGIKAQILDVSSIVPFVDGASLGQFYTIAQAVDSNNDLVIYDITNDTANAINIRQVMFTGRLSIREMHNVQAWRLSFRLREYLSVPEKKEQRQEAQTLSGSSTDTTQSAQGSDEDNLSGFERVLKIVDDSLA